MAQYNLGWVLEKVRRSLVGVAWAGAVAFAGVGRGNARDEAWTGDLVVFVASRVEFLWGEVSFQQVDAVFQSCGFLRADQVGVMTGVSGPLLCFTSALDFLGKAGERGGAGAVKRRC